MNLSAVILAGGESRRMGRDKAWVECGGQPLITLALEKIRRAGVREIFISGRPGQDYSALNRPVLFDLKPGFGPLGGVERALGECSAPLLLVLAVDLPQMTTAFLTQLAAQCGPSTGVVPLHAGQMEPLAAIYPKRCHSLAGECLAQQRHAARDFAAACEQAHTIKTWPVPAAEAICFSNWNSPDDLPQSLPAQAGRDSPAREKPRFVP